jgi:aminoglycoside phosphotransferase (APT) family kinase protein
LTPAAPGNGVEPGPTPRQELERYLARALGPGLRLEAVRPLGAGPEAGDDPKAFGYGVPLELVCTVDGVRQSFVLARTRPAQGFGHDYPADRAWQALFAHQAYNTFPRHARSLDVGVVRASGTLDSVADAVEFFQLVEKVEGTPYWRDLERLLARPLDELDRARAQALAHFLAEVHAVKRQEPTLYHRRIRELVAHGECLMGILDSYPEDFALLGPEVAEEIERAAVAWRWRLRPRVHRLSRTHGDFHPWNLLFREGTDFSVLDRSRGEWGEPADDVAALGINYLFYGLRRQAGRAGWALAEPFPRLFEIFLTTYLDATKDAELLGVLPPFLAFRALVIAHPRWYPDLPAAVRSGLIHFARRLMTRPAFDLTQLDELFGERP